MTGAAFTLEEALRLFTQCSKCETVFRLSAEVLRAAGGQVRCGRCGEVFNALARLAEDSNGFVGGESALDLEERADSILESVGVPQIAQAVAKDSQVEADEEEFGPPGVEIARLEVLGWNEDDAMDDQPPDDDRSLEFTLPPGELDRIFVESKKRPSRPVPAAVPDPTASPASTTAPIEAAEPEFEASPDVDRRHSHFEVPEVSDDVRRDMLEGFEEAARPDLLGRDEQRAGAERRRFALWLGAAIASALLLLGQVAIQNRGSPMVRALFGALGAPQAQPANFAAYQLRQWGVTGDPDANGTLRVRASILNTAPSVAALSSFAGKARRSLRQAHRHARLRAIRVPGQAHGQAARPRRTRGCHPANSGSRQKCRRLRNRRVPARRGSRIACANDVAPQSPR